MKSRKQDSTSRVDEYGRAYKGSQLQVQLYVNLERSSLDAALKTAFPALEGADITWRTPVPKTKYREPRDAAFFEIAGLDQRVTQGMREFWPRGGPVWDGVATVSDSRHPASVLLLEGKNYPAEMVSACRASSRESREMIERALDTTRRKLRAHGGARAWTDTYYQAANRLAWLWRLRDLGVPTWLAFLCFTDDHRHGATSQEEWIDDLRRVEDVLGVQLSAITGVGVAFLPALTAKRTELPLTH